jgi:hypothetical protein
MTEPLFQQAPLEEAVRALRDDVLAGHISTMRNYRFAILPYDPTEEFKLRQKIQRLTHELKAEGWSVLPVSLQKLLLDRVRSLGPEVIESMVSREKKLHAKDPVRALDWLRERIAPHIEGPDGIAADVVRCIDDFVRANPDSESKTLVIIGRAGALYPFFRTSALLRHIDGKVHQLPVVLLYPGKRRDLSALSFMGEVPADRDYRPRIYP